MGQTEFARVVERQVLPPWNAERERMSKMKFPREQQAIADKVEKYMSLRAEGQKAGCCGCWRKVAEKAILTWADLRFSPLLKPGVSRRCCDEQAVPTLPSRSPQPHVLTN